MCHGVILIKYKNRIKEESVLLDTESAFNLKQIQLRNDPEVDSFTTFPREKRYTRRIDWDEQTYRSLVTDKAAVEAALPTAEIL